MTIANTNQVVVLQSGEIEVIYIGQEIPAASTPWSAPVPTASQLTAQAKVTQSALLNAACASAITSGFSSLALGSAYTYPSGRNDQTNLAANVLSSMYPALPATWTTPQMCCSSAGVWAYVAHTAAQIQQVGLDGKSAIMAILVHNATQQKAVLAAKKVSAVLAVIW